MPFTVTAVVFKEFGSVPGDARFTGRLFATHVDGNTYNRNLDFTGDADLSEQGLVSLLAIPAGELASLAIGRNVGYHGHLTKVAEPDAGVYVFELDFDGANFRPSYL